MPNRTLQEIIAEGLSEAAVAEHGRPLTQYLVTVGSERIGGVTDPDLGSFVTLTVHPVGFEYKAETFGIDNNTLLTREELDARKQFHVNEARVVRDASQQPVTTGGTAE